MSLRTGEEVRLKRKIVICGEKMRRRADDGTEIMRQPISSKNFGPASSWIDSQENT